MAGDGETGSVEARARELLARDALAAAAREGAAGTARGATLLVLLGGGLLGVLFALLASALDEAETVFGLASGFAVAWSIEASLVAAASRRRIAALTKALERAGVIGVLGDPRAP